MFSLKAFFMFYDGVGNSSSTWEIRRPECCIFMERSVNAAYKSYQLYNSI